jgi:hypothetical protein
VRIIGQIILVCLVISALQRLVAVLAIGIVFCVLIGLLVEPQRTVGFMVLSLLFTGFSVHPWLTAAVLGLLLGIVLIADGAKAAKKESAVLKGLPSRRSDVKEES